MQKSNTAVICLSPNSGGMEINAMKLAQKLSPYSDITLIAKQNSFIEDSHSKYIKNDNISIETIDFSSSISFSIYSRTKELIKKYNIKNVIFFGASELKSIYFALLGHDINLIIVHSTTKSTPKKSFFHRLIYSDVNWHIAICKHLEKNVKKIIPFGKKSRSKVIYSSFDIEKAQKTQNDLLTILHIGRIAHGKGQTDAISACKSLVENNIDFEFLIVGGYENEKYKEEFLNFYDNITYKEKIKLIGFTDDVKKFISKSDIFLFPSYGEGLSNAFIEALSSDLVCISYDNTSFSEFKELGFYTHLIKDRDIDELSNKLLFVSKNIDNEKLRSEPNFELAKNIFNTQQEVDSYLEILI
ncbi:MAG: glycosyltransferase [Sulfurimonas sp.]|nr:glycosyltransferase [Sulfurimonas sp.]